MCLHSLRRQGAAVLDQPAPSVCQTSLRQQCQGNARTHAHTHTHTHTHTKSNRVVNMTLVQALGVCSSGREVSGKPWHFPWDSRSPVCLFRNVTCDSSWVQLLASLCTGAGPPPGESPLYSPEKSLPSLSFCSAFCPLTFLVGLKVTDVFFFFFHAILHFKWLHLPWVSFNVPSRVLKLWLDDSSALSSLSFSLCWLANTFRVRSRKANVKYGRHKFNGATPYSLKLASSWPFFLCSLAVASWTLIIFNKLYSFIVDICQTAVT